MSIFSSVHSQLAETTRRFCEEHINPYAVEWDRGRSMPLRRIFQGLGELGLLGINKPESSGGMGLDYSYQLAFCEALGHSRSAAVNLAVGVQVDMATPALARHGSEELKELFLKPTIAGAKIACLGVSEIGAGSDMASISTSAKKVGDDYEINGGKMWTTNGSSADWMCVLAVTGVGGSQLNKSLICLPLDAPGVWISEPLDKLGMHPSDTVEVRFDSVRVPQAYRIGQEGRGLLYQMQSFTEERLWAAASGLVPLERIVKETVEYASARRIYGRTLLQNQAIQYRLAELLTSIEALRSLVYRTVQEYVAGSDIVSLSAMCKLMAGRLQREVTDACLQYWGGMGFLTETEVSRYYRDMRLTSIGGGADEVMLAMICRLNGLSSSISD